MDSNKSSDDESRDFSRQSPSPHQAHTPYRFNEEELRVLRQCNQESFYQRSLPISTILSVGTYYAVKTGYWKGHPRFGPTPKVFFAATVGYLIGKFSYQSKCAEKLMQLKNSPIGEMLRQRRQQGGYQELLTDPTASIGWSTPDTSAEPPRDWDADRPVYEGIDDFSRPPFSSPLVEEEVILTPPPQRNTTYEELRMKNREDYERRVSKMLSRPPALEEPNIHPQQTSPNAEPRSSAPWPKPKNKYGDVWEE